MINCTKAIIPVAGFGTRRLPITKAIEKCMLPIGNRPVIDYVVEDCLKAGVTDIFFVVGEQNDQIHRYYGKNDLLERYLTSRGKTRELELIDTLATEATFHYITQTIDMPYGTAVPLGLCKDVIKPGEQVLVMMGDDFIFDPDGGSSAQWLLEAVKASGAQSGMLGVKIAQEDVVRYGVLAVHTENGHQFFDQIVEKPSPQAAPSNLINVSKYLFDASMFDFVQQVLQADAPAGNEFQVTDALNLYVGAGKPLAVVEAKGEYLDGGTLDGWLYANQRMCKS